MLDFMIRDASDNKKNLDDVMKLIYKRFGGTRGFCAKDIEQAAKQICHCNNEVATFFRNYVYQGKTIDFNKYLQFAGLQCQLSYSPAKDNAGQRTPDLRVYTWQPIGDSLYHIGMTNPTNCWTNAGIHTGDIIMALNGLPIKNRQNFYAVINSLHIDDTLWVTTKHNESVIKIPVIVAGYNEPVVNIVLLNNSSLRQQKLLQQWKKGI